MKWLVREVQPNEVETDPTQKDQFDNDDDSRCLTFTLRHSGVTTCRGFGVRILARSSRSETRYGAKVFATGFQSNFQAILI
jgi:hypothetical protein